MSYSVPLPSAEEAQKFENVPLEAEQYNLKIAKVDLEYGPSYGDPSKFEWVYKIVALVIGLRAGGDILNIKGAKVPPFTQWLFKNINPLSFGFMKGTNAPSAVRMFLACASAPDATGKMSVPQDINAVSAPDFVLLNKKDEIVSDPAIRTAYIEDLKLNMEDRKLTPQYHHLPDLRPYEGRYISGSVTIHESGKRNVLGNFIKLPANFVLPDQSLEAEKMAKFITSYNKMLASRGRQTIPDNNASTQNPIANNGVAMADIPY